MVQAALPCDRLREVRDKERGRRGASGAEPDDVRHVTSTGLGMPTHSSFGCAAALFHERVIGPEAYRRPTLHDYFATRNFFSPREQSDAR